MGKLNDKIKELEKQIKFLESKINDISKNVESKVIKPYSKLGYLRDFNELKPVDVGTGYRLIVPWNDSELLTPPYGAQPSLPTKGFNKHSHSRYAGGAFDINTLEFVEYQTDENGNIIDAEENILNRHCQQFWNNPPSIVISQNEAEENVSRIGKLDGFVFDPDNQVWRLTAVYAEEEEQDEEEE